MLPGGWNLPGAWGWPAAAWAQPYGITDASALLVQRDGFIDGREIVPAGWFQEAGSAHMIGGNRLTTDIFGGPFRQEIRSIAVLSRRGGIFGQHMYINPSEKLVDCGAERTA